MRTTKKSRAKARKKNHKRSPAKVRSSFMETKVKKGRIKSKGPRTVSSSKVGKGNAVTRAITVLRRFMGLPKKT